MAFKRGSSKEALHHRGRNNNYRLPVKSVLVISVLLFMLFLANRVAKIKSTADQKKNLLRQQLRTGDWRKLTVVEELEDLFPKKVVDLIVANIHDSGPLNLNLDRRTDLSSSWVWERPVDQSIGKKKSDQLGANIVYSKWAGIEIEFNGVNHLLVKEDDIVGVLDTDDIKDLKPFNDRVLIKVAEVEEKTTGGLLLTESAKEKPSIGTIIAVGPGAYDEEGKRKQMSVTAGNTVLYSKFADSKLWRRLKRNEMKIRIVQGMLFQTLGLERS